ncbi:MAG: ATP-dependent Clp protease proteolytic subunit [Bacteroidia bacterium]
MSSFNPPFPRERKLYLSAQVNQESMLELTKKIIEINEDDKKIKQIYKLYNFNYKPKPIKIFIDSYGGSVYQCFGLLSVIASSKVPIHTIVTGCAMSCGFMIAITGHKRFAYDKATLLYHQVSSFAAGKLKEMKEDLIESKRLQKMIESHVLSTTKISKSRLKESFNKKEDWFIPTKEALSLGIIDKIIK